VACYSPGRFARSTMVGLLRLLSLSYVSVYNSSRLSAVRMTMIPNFFLETFMVVSASIAVSVSWSSEECGLCMIFFWGFMCQNIHSFCFGSVCMCSGPRITGPRVFRWQICGAVCAAAAMPRLLGCGNPHLSLKT